MLMDGIWEKDKPDPPTSIDYKGHNLVKAKWKIATNPLQGKD